MSSIAMSWDVHVLQLNINKSSMISRRQFGEWYLPLEIIASVSKLFDISAPNTESYTSKNYEEILSKQTFILFALLNSAEPLPARSYIYEVLRNVNGNHQGSLYGPTMTIHFRKNPDPSRWSRIDGRNIPSPE